MSLEMTKLELQQAKEMLVEVRQMLSAAGETYTQVSGNIGAYGGGTSRGEHGEAVSGFSLAAGKIAEIDSAIIRAESAIDSYVSSI